MNSKNAGGKNKKYTQENAEYVIKLAESHTQAEITKITGLSKTSVSSILKKAGVVATGKRQECDIGLNRRFTEDTDLLIEQCLSEGYTLAEIAELLHRDINSLKEYKELHQDRLDRAKKIMERTNSIYKLKLERKEREEKKNA